MEKHAWLIVPDLHLYYKNLSSRQNYVQEMRGILEKVEEIGAKYKVSGYDKVNMLLLGDVFHRSYQDVFFAVHDAMFFEMWRDFLGDVYSVMGNHEFHFYSSNPFFSLIREIESDKVKAISTDVWTPQGLLPVIRVVDRLDDGEVVFHFNHFGTPVSKPEGGKVNIGLFHQDIANQEIIRGAEQALQTKIFARAVDIDSIPEIDGYQYCFFGHMHQVFGIFRSESTTLFYLASLGRTNVKEVRDDFCERCVPAVLVEDGKLSSIEENRFQLPGRKSSVKEKQVIEKHEVYEVEKLRKQARSYEALNDNPTEDLLRYFGEDAVSTKIIRDLLCNEIDEIGIEVNKKFSELIGG